MKNLDKKQILLAGAIALGLVAVGKLIYDINKIRKLTAEKEEALAEEAVEEAPVAEEAGAAAEA